MKRSALRFVLSAAGAAALASCGGGTNESGSPTVFSVVPSTVTFTAPTGTASGVCVGGGTAQVFVYGGVAPYRVDNTSQAYLVVDRTTVNDKGGNFTVTSVGPCIDSGQIVVVDKLDNQVKLTVSNKPAGG
jgi:hypothetical protein